MAERAPLSLGDLKRVRDIMIPVNKYPRVRLEDTLLTAISTIESAHLEVGRRRSLPRVLLVFDGEDDLAGVVRRRDIMRGLEPDFLVKQPNHRRVRFFEVGVDPLLADLASEVSLERVVKGLREQSKRRVADVLHPIPIMLKPDDSIMKAVYEMVTLNESLIPVEEEGEVLGVVRSVDLFHELAQLLG